MIKGWFLIFAALLSGCQTAAVNEQIRKVNEKISNFTSSLDTRGGDTGGGAQESSIINAERLKADRIPVEKRWWVGIDHVYELPGNLICRQDTDGVIALYDTSKKSYISEHRVDDSTFIKLNKGPSAVKYSETRIWCREVMTTLAKDKEKQIWIGFPNAEYPGLVRTICYGTTQLLQPNVISKGKFDPLNTYRDCRLIDPLSESCSHDLRIIDSQKGYYKDMPAKTFPPKRYIEEGVRDKRSHLFECSDSGPGFN